MKITNCLIRSNLLTIAILVLIIFVIKPAKSQNQKQESGTKTMKIKVVKEKDGKKTVFDTIIYQGNSINQEEMEDMMKKLKSDMKELEMQLKSFSSDYSMKALDSLELDSLTEGLDKVIVLGNCGKNGKLEMNCLPKGYKYNFDFDTDLPNVPECPMMWQDFDNEEFNLRFPAQINDFPGFNEENETGSLNELLGKIPMERVKSYSIKDRKNGKRIIIDIENSPTFESHDKTIIIREPGPQVRMKNRHGRPDRDVRVIIKSDRKDTEEAPESGPDDKRDANPSPAKNPQEKI